MRRNQFNDKKDIISFTEFEEIFNEIIYPNLFADLLFYLFEYKIQGKNEGNYYKLVESNLKNLLLPKNEKGSLEEMKFNTAISSMMILVNEIEKEKSITKESYETLLKLLAPFAPHFTEEIWTSLKNTGSIHSTMWPKYDENKLINETVNIMIQINGKVRGMISANIDSTEEFIKKEIEKMPEISKWIEGKEI
jgi:leucyl-tRNA synthetase